MLVTLVVKDISKVYVYLIIISYTLNTYNFVSYNSIKLGKNNVITHPQIK